MWQISCRNCHIGKIPYMHTLFDYGNFPLELQILFMVLDNKDDDYDVQNYDHDHDNIDVDGGRMVGCL